MGPGVLPPGVVDSSELIVNAIHQGSLAVCGCILALIVAVTWRY